MDLNSILESERLRSIGVKSPITVTAQTSSQDIISLLHRKKKGCVIVLENEKVIGICTERDLMTKVIEPGKPISTPASEIMTQNPESLSIRDSIQSAIKLMHSGGYRHVPILEADELIGYISVKDVVDYLAENFPHGIFNLPPNFRQQNKAAEGA